mmetsp:Transcript_11730/g.38586  ORF Transcript_11730/g.38586 Transcript_11730/m.38586 type:complete len:205 (+) Transcript_11730:20-634(+)
MSHVWRASPACFRTRGRHHRHKWRRSCATSSTKTWLEDIIIKLNLCPFALAVKDDVRIAVSAGERNTDVVEELQRELELVRAAPSEATATTLVVLPQASYAHFEAFREFMEETEAMLGSPEDVLLVPFHPEAAYSPFEDAGDFANRSPHATIHLLRRCDVEAAQASYAERGLDTSDIADENAARLRGLGSNELRAALDRCRAAD